jgi:class 3 adenylate cyclase
VDDTKVLEPPLLAIVEAMRGEAFEGWLATGTSRQGSRMYLSEVALVFSDVVGSTTLLFDIGDDVYDVVLRHHFERARELVSQYGGLEIDTAGDGLFCAFRTVPDAVAYALALWAQPGDPRITVRAGIHYGPTKFRGTSFCGRTVHFASRVMSQAVGSEVWLSDEAKEHLDSSKLPGGPPQLEEFPACTLKNVPGTWRLWRVAGNKGA